MGGGLATYPCKNPLAHAQGNLMIVALNCYTRALCLCYIELAPAPPGACCSRPAHQRLEQQSAWSYAKQDAQLASKWGCKELKVQRVMVYLCVTITGGQMTPMVLPAARRTFPLPWVGYRVPTATSSNWHNRTTSLQSTKQNTLTTCLAVSRILTCLHVPVIHASSCSKVTFATEFIAPFWGLGDRNLLNMAALRAVRPVLVTKMHLTDIGPMHRPQNSRPGSTVCRSDTAMQQRKQVLLATDISVPVGKTTHKSVIVWSYVTKPGQIAVHT
jgi:hypothetical protein